MCLSFYVVISFVISTFADDFFISILVICIFIVGNLFVITFLLTLLMCHFFNMIVCLVFFIIKFFIFIILTFELHIIAIFILLMIILMMTYLIKIIHFHSISF